MLRRKFFRTIRLYRAQFLSMILMIALGVGVFVGFHAEWYSLEKNVLGFFRQTGFADYRLLLEKGFLERDAEKIAAIPGVEAVSRFFALNVGVKGSKDILAVNVTTNPEVSGFLVSSGEAYDPAGSDGLWLSDRYAEANGIGVGDELALVYKNVELKTKVRGLVKAGEYLICVPDSSQIMPDYQSFGFAYVSPALLKKAIVFEYYPQLHIRSELSRKDFRAAAENALGRSVQLLDKEDSISYAEAMGECKEGKTMGAFLPVLFLAIAILSMVTTLHRLTATEKTQIGTLKSLGFPNRRILRHYSFYGLAAGILGTLPGIGLGFLLARSIMDPAGSMGSYLDMPDWSIRFPSFVWWALAIMNLFLLFIGWLSVHRILRGTAAESLRPYVPAKMKALLLEKTALWKKLSFGSCWNLRDILRHRARSSMTLVGIVGCMLLLVGGFGMQDTMNAFMDQFYHEALRYDSRLNLDAESVTDEEADELIERYRADSLAESHVEIGEKTIALEIYHVRHNLLRFSDGHQHFVNLADEGAYICRRLAEREHLAPGDELRFKVFGTDQHYRVKVAGILRSLTDAVVMSRSSAKKLGLPLTPGVLFTSERDIAKDARIVSVQSKEQIIRSFDTFIQIMNMMIWILAVAACVLGAVVLYNLGVMSYTERYREMATLKVIGFSDRKIGRLLISQNLWLTLLGIFIGLPAGMGVLQLLIDALAAEYELDMILGWKTYVLSILLTFMVSWLVALILARKNRRIDMVAAMKAEE